jgi:hypothetical protein
MPSPFTSPAASEKPALSPGEAPIIFRAWPEFESKVPVNGVLPKNMKTAPALLLT